ncbi:hypothetical protein LUZ61_005599 [Rhynchospora tenuis]|uniref:non-specific serine/threonine protein kinase n=1 Tax=Rhynchospora tenuis TaxID=198213 RepID=A0AAD5ZQ84_9POAL|nr:hypothetical protein LUZ61_005599 [Rhynchospora tenuis]
MASWNESELVCLWKGIRCGSSPGGKRVTSLELQFCGLAGSISPSLGNLSFLVTLRLSGNQLTGQVPQELGRLSQLQHLNLSNNYLEGHIPETLGSSGSVYKARLKAQSDSDEKLVAVKVINLQDSEALRSFFVECEAIRNLRHRNIIKIITLCSSADSRGNEFNAIVYKYMLNGSLDDWLHHKRDGKNLDLGRRLSIAIDVASALDYIHHHCGTPIVHRDIKPSNVLLDADMVACLGDFGLARFVERNSGDSTQFRGTIGYACPEYGTGNIISKYGDIYSYGILLLEMITERRPTDDMFTDGLSLREYVRRSVPYNAIDVLDERLLVEIEKHDACDKTHIKRTKLECASLMLEVGLLCSEEIPERRMSTRDIINELNGIREMFMQIT